MNRSSWIFEDKVRQPLWGFLQHPVNELRKTAAGRNSYDRVVHHVYDPIGTYKDAWGLTLTATLTRHSGAPPQADSDR